MSYKHISVFIMYECVKAFMTSEPVSETDMNKPRLQRMSRKRFIKLCMASGMNRNHARQAATYLQEKRRITAAQNGLNKAFGILWREKPVSYAEAAWLSNLIWR